MDLINVRLITPERHRPSKRPVSEIAKARIEQLQHDDLTPKAYGQSRPQRLLGSRAS
jgi:hypothetical protein